MAVANAAVVENGVVTNVIVVDVNDHGKTDFELPNAEIVVLPEDSQVTFGYTYSNGHWTAPAVESAADSED